MTRTLGIILVWVLAVTGATQAQPPVTTREPAKPTVRDMIDQITSREKKCAHLVLSGTIKARSRGHNTLEDFELRRQNEHVIATRRLWGNMRSRRINKAAAARETRVFDGKVFWYLVEPPGLTEQPSVQITQQLAEAQKQALSIGQSYRHLLHMQVTNRPYSVFLRQTDPAPRLVRNRKINGQRAIGLRAALDEGKLTLWLSPKKHHAIVQAELIVHEGHTLHSGQRAPEGYHEKRVLTVRNITRLDEHGLPTAVVYFHEIRLPGEKSTPMTFHATANFQRIELGAKADAAAIALPVLPVGTQASFHGDTNPNGSIRFYRWTGERFVFEPSPGRRK